MIKRKYIYSSVTKHFLRELPDPLLCSFLAKDWKSLDQSKNELENGGKLLVNPVGEGSRSKQNKISIIIGFLAKLEKENKFNMKTIKKNSILSPNLLWDSNGIHIPNK